MLYTYILYDEKDSFGISKSDHIKCEAIMMEFRRNQEIGENIREFINFIKREFGEDFEQFEYDNQENHMILANLQDQADEHV
ncbi:hypothetical protein V7024_07350 [Bacillus sp. JJ864]|uniref:hypothetical protein n=1 Tax=Bacillus sp. JJ864 TaxID=3122975 RepID=UPI0030000697